MMRLGQRASVLVALSVLISGCAGRFDYSPPPSAPSIQITRVVGRPFDAIWKDLVPAVGSRFFVINNIDKASGLIVTPRVSPSGA